MTSWGEVRSAGAVTALGSQHLWLGADGCPDGAAPVVVRHGGSGPAAHNLAALHPLSDVVAREVTWVGEDHRHRVLGRLDTGGGVDLAATQADLLAAVWTRMLHALGPLPWSEVLVVRSDGRWPAAFSVPGAVVLRPVLDLDRPVAVVLYLVHELVHQWLGGMVRSPGATGHEQLEAEVEALTWYLVEQEQPRAGAAFAGLHRDRPEVRRRHADLTRRGAATVRHQLLPPVDGRRAVFRAPEGVVR